MFVYLFNIHCVFGDNKHVTIDAKETIDLNDEQSTMWKAFFKSEIFFFNGLSIIFYFPLNILGQLNKSNFFMLKLQKKN